MNAENGAAYIEALVRRGGPRPDDYETLYAWYLSVMTRYYANEISQDDLASLWKAFGESFSTETMQGWVVRKPHGYHGDFEVIDRIYTKRTATDERLRNWDVWFHQLKAVQAVRNRKDYFHNLLAGMKACYPSRPARILNVGSGSCRDVFEFFDKTSCGGLLFTCLDQDPKALEYARALCSPFNGQVSFARSSILRFSSSTPFALVWSAGVFDYLDDRLFVTTLKRLLRLVASDGQVVLGNFSPNNPTRPIMEFGGWKLHHRSEQDLVSLAIRSGMSESQITVASEPEKVNLFLHIRKGTRA